MSENIINVSYDYMLKHNVPVKIKDGKRTFPYKGSKHRIVRADNENKCYICVKEEE